VSPSGERAVPAADAKPLLQVAGLRVAYGRVPVLHGIDFEVGAGEILTIVGANGSGKSTLLKAISGVVATSAGRVMFKGEPLVGRSVEAIACRGVVQIPEGRQLFAPLSVAENLELGGYLRGRDGGQAKRLEEVYELFPRLAERRAQAAGTLSGGEQQMLAIGRALVAEPQLLLLDEPSMGLAPLIVREIFEVLARLNREGLPMVLVEQDARLALRVAHRGLVLERGCVVLEGSGAELLNNPDVQAIYFGRRGAG